MKYLLISLFLCLFYSNSLKCQTDKQWIIKEGQGISKMIWKSIASASGDTLHTHFINQPNTTPPDTSQSQTGKKCNDFFAIFSDGSYYMSNRESNDCPLEKYNPVEGTSFSYVFDNYDGIQYMYLTNRYEEDDPPPKVKVQKSQKTGSGLMEIIDIGLKRDTSFNKIANHDIVDGSEMTFIVKTKATCSNYSLCFDGNNVGFVPKSFKIDDGGNSDHNNVIYSDGSSLQYLNLAFQNKCLLIPDILVGKTVFINFRAEFLGSYQYTNNGDSVNFSLSADGCTTKNFNERISDLYHDPNYIELQNVWEDKEGRKFAKYHVECFNDEGSAVEHVTLEAILPESAIMNSIVLLEWNDRCRSSCGDLLVETINENDRFLKVRFPRGLSGYSTSLDSCHYTAWFEFIVELKKSTKLYTDDLSVSIPYSYFNIDEYFIYEFIDHYECIDTTSKEKDRQVENQNRDNPKEGQIIENQSIDSCHIVRVVREPNLVQCCECSWYEIHCCNIFRWPHFIISILIVLIIGFLLGKIIKI